MRIEIKRLGRGDAAVLDRVAEDVFDEPINPPRLAAYLAEPGHHMLVAIADGVVVGQVARRHSPPSRQAGGALHR